MSILEEAARRSEVFRLTWNDIDFSNGVVRLTTQKTRDGSVRHDYIPMSGKLRRTLLHWWQVRPIRSEYVFTMLDNAFAAATAQGTLSNVAAILCGGCASGPG